MICAVDCRPNHPSDQRTCRASARPARPRSRWHPARSVALPEAVESDVFSPAFSRSGSHSERSERGDPTMEKVGCTERSDSTVRSRPFKLDRLSVDARMPRISALTFFRITLGVRNRRDVERVSVATRLRYADGDESRALRASSPTLHRVAGGQSGCSLSFTRDEIMSRLIPRRRRPLAAG